MYSLYPRIPLPNDGQEYLDQELSERCFIWRWWFIDPVWCQNIAKNFVANKCSHDIVQKTGISAGQCWGVRCVMGPAAQWNIYAVCSLIAERLNKMGNAQLLCVSSYAEHDGSNLNVSTWFALCSFACSDQTGSVTMNTILQPTSLVLPTLSILCIS